MSRRHGFPFDINIELKVPKYYDGSGIAKLLIKCLQEGYNVLDSYQLLKINGEDLALVVENMRNLVTSVRWNLITLNRYYGQNQNLMNY